MISTRLHNQTLALAALFQAAQLVRECALSGHLHDEAFQSSLQSVLMLDAPDVPAIYGGITPLSPGLAFLAKFGEKKPAFGDKIILRYVMQMLFLARTLIKKQDLFAMLRRRLEPAISQAHHMGADHAVVIHTLASIYNRVFVDNKLRIAVMGRAEVLKQPLITEKIRVLLLAGIRAGVLWHQLGGNRWQLLFSRRTINREAASILKDLKEMTS